MSADERTSAVLETPAVTAISLDYEGKKLAVGDEDGTVCIYKLQAGFDSPTH
jgi:hypothetical protein